MYIHVKLMCCHYHFITGSGGYQDRATTKVRLISDPSRNSQLLSPHYFLLSEFWIGVIGSMSLQE